MAMNKQAAKESMLAFANYLSSWAEYYDDLGYFEVADGITHIVTHMCKEASNIDFTEAPPDLDTKNNNRVSEREKPFNEQ